MKPRVLVTSALPYANGPIHIGHLVEYIQTDVYVRFLRLCGREVIYCCADDAHGTAIEMSAGKEGITPEELIGRVHAEHLRDFTDFQIRFDSYYSTHSPENEHWANRIFKALVERGDILTREVERTFCDSCTRFLPDRYVKGTCPKCSAGDQYGDVCEKCNSTYDTTDLVEPYCSICGNEPQLRSSKHYFFHLANYEEFLRSWLKSASWLQSEVGNYLLNWVDEGLRDWEISRDGPYFGFRIPGEENKFFYVWLDAPIGYIASTEHFCERSDLSVSDYWESDDSEIIHFIGKDIIYFHFLFWPAMLHGAGLRVPDRLCVHGFLTVNGEKMSKSRGTYLTARQFLEHFDAEHLRFFYAKLITSKVADVDLNIEEFKTVINSELAANIGNFANRVLKFTSKNFDGKIDGVGADEVDRQVQQQVLDELAEARRGYEAVNLAAAVRHILAASSIGNKYFQDAAPWALIRSDKAAAHGKVGLALNILKNLAVALSPVLPVTASNLAGRLGLEIESWDQIDFDLTAGQVAEGAIPVEQIKELPSFEPEAARRVAITVHPDLSELGINCCLAQVEGTTVRAKSKAVDDWRRRLEEGFKGLTGEEEPLRASRAVYAACGIDALTPYEHLAQLLAEGGKLPALNTAVDAGNLVSLEHLVSVGMHDIPKVEGNVHLRFARQSDRYTPLGEGEQARLTDRTFVFVDDGGTVLCWLDAKQGGVTPVIRETNDVLIIVSGNRAVPDEKVEQAARQIAEKVAEIGGGTVHVTPAPLFEPELRVARIEAVQDHPDADRLYIFQIDLGYEQRQIVAGVRGAIPKEELEGRHIVVVANLAPAVLRGVESNGMFLAAAKKKKLVAVTTSAAEGTLVAPAPCRVGHQQIDIDTFGRYPMTIEGKRVLWEGRPLIAGAEAVTAEIADGAKVK